MANAVDTSHLSISIPTPNVKTQTSFSVQLFVKGDDFGGGTNPAKTYLLGTAQEATPSQSRRNTPVGGVGFGDYIKELVAGRSSYTLKLTKTSLWTASLQKISGYNDLSRMLAQMQAPIQIYQYHVNPSNSTDIRVTHYQDCMIKDWTRAQRWDDNVVIVDEITLDVRKINSGDPDVDIADVTTAV